MKILKRTLGVLRQTCIFFTVIVVLFYLITNSMISTTLVLEISGVLGLLLFSLILALANLIFGIEKMPAVLRALLHYLIITAIITIGFFYYGGENSSVRTALIIAFSLAVLYAIVTAIVMAVSIRLRTARSDKADYKPQFAAATEDRRVKGKRK